MTAHRNFVKASAASALAVGLPIASKLNGQTGSPQMNFYQRILVKRAQMTISVSMQMECGAQPVGGAESSMPRTSEVAIPTRIRRLLTSSPGRKPEY